MSSEIENVPIEEASIGTILSTTGISSCITVLILLDDNRAFIFHSDPSCIDLENRDHMEYEVQKLIKETLSMFNKCGNKNSSCFEEIFVIGGLCNHLYTRLNDEFNRMKKSFTTVTPLLDELNLHDLQSFLKRMVYCNTIFNLDGGNADAAQGNVIISDTTILVDLTISPPLLFLAQYHALERNLHGGHRTIEPHLFLVYNFNRKSWDVIQNQSSIQESGHTHAIVDQFAHNLLVDVQFSKGQLMNYLSSIQH